MLGNQLLVYRSHELHACYPEVPHPVAYAYVECNICETILHHKIIPKVYGTLHNSSMKKVKDLKEISECAEKVFSAHSRNAGIASSVFSSENFSTRSCGKDVMSSARIAEVLPLK